MILPIVAYGDPVLRKICREIGEQELGEIKLLIEDMFATMYKASGVGLAAPQVGKAIRLFVVDTHAIEESDPAIPKKGLKQAFINARVIAEHGEEWGYEEGCLSIPGIRETVVRKSNIILGYRDLEWNWREEEFSGYEARVIQHEYDHIEGKLFIDHLSPLKRSLLKSKLIKISKGVVEHEYKMRFPAKA